MANAPMTNQLVPLPDCTSTGKSASPGPSGPSSVTERVHSPVDSTGRSAAYHPGLANTSTPDTGPDVWESPRGPLPVTSMLGTSDTGSPSSSNTAMLRWSVPTTGAVSTLSSYGPAGPL